MAQETYANCPKCGNDVPVPRRTAFKYKCAAGGVLGGIAAGGTAGAIYGAGTGIASGGTAIAGTVPVGVAAGAVTGLICGIGAKVGAEWAVARVTCNTDGCGNQFRI